MTLNSTCIVLEFLCYLCCMLFFFFKVNMDYVLEPKGFLWTEMTRSTNYVVAQYCREEDHLASTINNKACNCTCMSHTILPTSCSLMLCVSGPPSHASLPGLARPLRDPGPGTWHCEEAPGRQAGAGCSHRCQLTPFREPRARADRRGPWSRWCQPLQPQLKHKEGFRKL